MSAHGLLDAAPGGAPGHVRVDLDVRTQRFLRDHLVAGRALLSTVMGVETMACALAHAHPGARIAAITDVRVRPPYLLPATGRGHVDVELSGTATIDCAVRSAASTDAHFEATVELAAGELAPRVAAPVRPPSTPVVGGDLVYGLYFHGPSFRVVDAAWLDGPTITARLNRERPPLTDEPRRSLTAPLLVELCLQAAGLWDLAVHDAMTIPLGIGRIRRFSALDADTDRSLHAVVRNVADRGFDAAVVDDDGRVHVTVEGYRTTPFEHPYDRVAAERIRQALGSAAGEQGPRLG